MVFTKIPTPTPQKRADGPTGPLLAARPPFVPSDFMTDMNTSQPMKSPREAVRRVRRHDASNFDDYLVVGLITVVLLALVAAWILL